MTSYLAIVRVVSEETAGEVTARLADALAAGVLTGFAGVGVVEIVEET